MSTNFMPMLVVISRGGLAGVLGSRCAGGLSNLSPSFASGTTISAANALTTAITRPAMATTEVDFTNMCFILAGMAEENPRHNVLSLAGFIAAFYRVLP